MENKFKIVLCQMKVIGDEDSNIMKALDMIEISARNKSDFIILPEMFNCPYDINKFEEYTEERSNNKTLKAILKVFKRSNLFIIAGSIPELDNGKLYNSSFVFNENGEIIGHKNAPL